MFMSVVESFTKLYGGREKLGRRPLSSCRLDFQCSGDREDEEDSFNDLVTPSVRDAKMYWELSTSEDMGWLERCWWKRFIRNIIVDRE